MPDLNGQLSVFTVRQVLELLAGTTKTGELRLQTPQRAARILVTDGDIAYATTATGADTVQELDRLLARYQTGGDSTGVGPDTIELAFEEQVTNVLDETLDWDSGTFEFGTRQSVEGGAVHVSSVERAVDLVEERRTEWLALRQLIPTNDSVYSLAPQLPEGVSEATFDGLRWRLLALIGDGGSVDFIARELGVSDYRAARLLADLIEAGYVRPDHETPDEEPVAAVPEVFEQLASESEQERDAEEGDGEASELFDEVIVDDDFFDDPPVVDEPEPLPDLQPREEPVTFSAGDLSQEEKDELIRNMGKGIFPS